MSWNLPRLTLCLIGIALLARTTFGAEPARQFRCGAATSNITPPLGCSINGGFGDRRATQIHDELFVRCMVLDDGKTRLALAVCDSCAIPRDVMDEAKRLLAERIKLAADHVMISATHTHEAPTAAAAFQSKPDPEYLKFLSVRIADGIQRAVNNLAPARIGWGAGKVPGQVFNRRWRMKPGSIPPDPFGGTSDQVQMNPAPGSPNLVEPAGPTDPEVAFVSVQSLEGRPIALLANYSLHYVGGELPGAISADYFGMFADRIQERLGADRLDPPFVGIMSNGTSGNINNIDFSDRRKPQPPYGQMRIVANEVADEVFRAMQNIKYHDWMELDARQTKLELAVRKPKEEELREAKSLLAKITDRPLISSREVYANETVALADFPDREELILQAFRIGDLAIIAVPCEVFIEIGLELKAKTPFEQMFTIELANGCNGYLPTPEHHKLGGYETWRARSSHLEIDAAPKIAAALEKMVAELKQNSGSK